MRRRRRTHLLAKDPHAALEILLSTWPTAAGERLLGRKRVDGQLLSCPKTGCADLNPTVITTGLEKPTGLAADDDSLYILEPPQYHDTGTTFTMTRPGRILKCPLSGCVQPTVVYASTTEVWINQLKVDDRFVYFSGTDCGPNLPWGSPCGLISAIPK